MKLPQLARSTERVLQLDTASTAIIEDGTLVRVAFSGRSGSIRVADYVCAFEARTLDDAEWLEVVTASGAYLAEFVAQTSPSASGVGARSIVLRVFAFDGVDRWATSRAIGIDDLTVEDVNRHRGRSDAIEDVVAWIERELILEGPVRAAVQFTGAASGASNDAAFRLVGATVLVDIRLHDDQLLAVRVTRRPKVLEGRLVLTQGALAVSDATRMGQLSPADQLDLRRAVQADNAYLSIWDEYNALERKAAQEAARDIGWAEYDRVTALPDGSYEFQLIRHQRSDTLLQRLGIESVGMEAAAGVAFLDEPSPDGLIGTAHATHKGTIVMRPDRRDEHPPPIRGRLSGAFTLDRVRIGRRDKAQRTIALGETVVARQVGLLLSGSRPDSVGRTRPHDPMSERVRRILGGPPTPAQLRAIDLAINSRDVVLIQGPPGTGKTRVIAAIQARLTEINAHMPAIARRVLLTSYQHDAVSNLVLAADDGQLPPVKLGAASELDDDGYLVAWTHDLKARLDRRYADFAGHALVAQQRALRDRIEAYQLQPFDLLSTADLLEWLESSLDLVGATVVLDARRLGRELAHDVARSSVTAQADVLRLARGLRVTRDGFDDDGPAAADRARRSGALMALLTSDDAARLTQVATGVGSVSSEQTLDALGRVRRTLIDVVLDARARANVLAAMPAVSALLQRAQAAAQESVDERTSPIERAVARFRDAVEHQPSALRMSLQTHTRALAATCQQSVSTSMKSAQPALFNTVIIDEAARANPLDLMIPISLAQERVILVGDHRQLPQLLDDAIAPKLSSRHDPKIVDETLQKSLFERLFRQLRAVEGQGSEPRVVTLDMQFRMHPHLGDFVSRTFYAPYGESLSNADPNPASFQHGLRRYGTAACGWIHVPHARGGEQRTDTSIRRPAEASAVVQELHASLEETGKQTFGVITFYSAQRIAIWEAMLAAGLAVRAGDQHGLNPSIDWLFDERGLPRVRIGSVDAFQGREFDVVFLSTTRSQPITSNRRAHFGFLSLPNRLCVAMSRQRSLLVAVGDADMVSSPAGRDAVPALAQFFDMTGGDLGFRRTVP